MEHREYEAGIRTMTATVQNLFPGCHYMSGLADHFILCRGFLHKTFLFISAGATNRHTITFYVHMSNFSNETPVLIESFDLAAEGATLSFIIKKYNDYYSFMRITAKHKGDVASAPAADCSLSMTG